MHSVDGSSFVKLQFFLYFIRGSNIHSSFNVGNVGKYRNISKLGINFFLFGKRKTLIFIIFIAGDL